MSHRRQQRPADMATSSVPNRFQSRPFSSSFRGQASSSQIQPKVDKQSSASQDSQYDEAPEQQTGFNFGDISLFANDSTPPPPPDISPLVQAKLTIGQPNDRYEQEADNVAKEVVQQIHSPQLVQSSSDIQHIPLVSSSVMRLPLQHQSTNPVGTASDEFESSLSQARSGGSSLAPEMQTQMGTAMGADFSNVKVHTDAKADQLSQSIQAKAFTTGQDIFFKKGEYNPDSRGGQELIAHELTHVVQQKGADIQRAHQAGDGKWVQDTAELDPLYEEAKQAQGILNTIIGNLAGATEGRGIKCNPKKKKDAVDKMTRKRYPDASRLTDLARGSIAYETLGQARRGWEYICENQDGFRMLDSKNRFENEATDAGYRDININVAIPGANDHVAELQIHLEKMLEAKEKGLGGESGHALYERMREITKQAQEEGNRALTAEEKREYDELLEKSKELYAEAYGDQDWEGAGEPGAA